MIKLRMLKLDYVYDPADDQAIYKEFEDEYGHLPSGISSAVLVFEKRAEGTIIGIKAEVFYAYSTTSRRIVEIM